MPSALRAAGLAYVGQRDGGTPAVCSSRPRSGRALRAVEEITERLGLQGVHGPLYRLFEVTDDKFNTAVELTAGNR